MKQLNWFLSDVPGTACPKAGKAAYGEAVRQHDFGCGVSKLLGKVEKI